jgi:hypothetical protein
MLNGTLLCRDTVAPGTTAGLGSHLATKSSILTKAANGSREMKIGKMQRRIYL